MKLGTTSAMITLAASGLLGTTAVAELLGIQPAFPQLFFDNQGTTSYDATSDILSIDGTPTVMRFAAGDPPRFVDATGAPATKFTSISIEVDQNGDLVGGVPGDDLIVVGEVDSDGNGSIDFDGVLITGEISMFGFLNVGGNAQNSLGQMGTDLYDFRFTVTGGSLAPLFADGDIGIVLTSEMSTFMGDWGESFNGEAKGILGPIDPVGEGACCFANGFCMELPQDECIADDGLYQGDGTMCAQVDCLPPKGACCLEGGACGLLTQDNCAAEGGLYQGDNTLCEDVECPMEEGACCFNDGNCAILMPDDCLDQGGLPQGPGAVCIPNDCPMIPEACCLTDGSCAVVMADACLKLGGLPQGPGTDCTPNICPMIPEACCFEDGACALIMQADCIDQGGLPQGDGTNCEPNLCPQPKGACCFEDGDCAVVTQDECNAVPGLYQGDDTICTEVDCPGPTGACCLPDGGCEELEQDDCNAAGGLYQGDDTQCTPTTCPEEGGCCLDGDCTMQTQDDCQSSGGDYQGDGTECTPDLCLPIKGACCFVDGMCAFVEPDECSGAGGDYIGDGILCSPGLCPQPVGACCLPDGSCVEVMQDECLAQGGGYQGDFTMCDPGLCGPPEGACCFDDGSCVVVSQDDCGDLGGNYQGDDTECLPEQCPPIKGACCFDDGSCVAETSDECNADGGVYQGDNTICIPDLCPPPSGACCLPSGICIVTKQDECGEAGGLYQGDNTECVPELCVQTGACCLDDGSCVDVSADDCDAQGGAFLGESIPCGQVECVACAATTNVRWDLDGCVAFSSDGSALDYSEFTPDINGSCPEVWASIVYRDEGGHSCSSDRFGNNGKAMCFGTFYDPPDVVVDTFIPDSPEALRFDVTVDGPSRLNNLSFWQIAPDDFVWNGSDDPDNWQSGPNNPPQLFGLRVLRDGAEILRLEDLPTTSDWTMELFEFTGLDYVVDTGSTVTFSFELLSYAPEGDDEFNGVTYSLWDLDDIEVDVCCPGPAPGACCLDDDTCVVTDEWNCVDNLYGEYQGNGTSCPEVSGLLGQYFENDDWTQLDVIRVDPTIDFDWGNGNPAPDVGPNDYSVRWTGTITAPATDTYTIFTQADSGVFVWIDGEMIIDDPGPHETLEVSGSVGLVAGVPAEIRIDFRDTGDHGEMRLMWESGSITKEVVPSSALSGETCLAVGACCLPDGSCIETDQWNCVDWLDGDYQGDGTMCDGDQCPMAANITEKRVTGNNDDAEERDSDGFMYLDSSDLELAVDDDTTDMVGMRFTSLAIPAGATIFDAYIQFQTDETSSGAANLTLRGQDSNDAAQFGSSDGNISDRPTTSVSVAWSPPTWDTVGEAGPDQRTPNISSIIQEIVDRGGWSSGNDLVIIISGSGTRTAESHDGGSGAAPLLHVEWSP